MKKFFVVTAIIISSQLSAQDTTTLEQVILTANKYSTKTTETGKVVITITRQEIEKAGSRDLAQVISEMGGVFINGYTNNAGKEKNIYLRGAKVDHTLITIDGIPLYDASGIGSNFDIRYFPIDNVERIEILKGSQGTLYGSDAIAGVINIITKKGGAKPSVNLVSHFGSYKTKRTGIGFNGHAGKADFNIGLNHFSTDGFSEAAQPEGSNVQYDKDGYSQNAIHANFGYQLNSFIRVQPFLRYSRNKGDLDQDAFTDEKDFTYTAQNFQAGIKNSFQIKQSVLNMLYQYNHTKRDYLDDSTSVNGYYFFNQSGYAAREHFAEAFIVVPFTNFRLTAGADLRASGTDYKALQQTVFMPGLINAAYSNDSIKQQQKSLYAALHFQKANFTLETGGRYNHHSEYGSNAAFNLNPSMLLNQRIKVFANFSSGYKVPSLYQLFSEYGNKILQPERSLNLEGGVQFLGNEGRSALRATYFKRNVKDVITFFFDPLTFQSQYINQDEQNDHGFEVDGKLLIGERFQLKAFYSFIDGEISTRQNGKDTSFFNLLRRPKSTLNLSFGAQINSRLFFNIQLNAVGKSKDIYFDPNTWQAVDVELKNYTLLNVYAEYMIIGNRLKLFADARNVLDQKYADIYGYNTAGLNAYGGIRIHF